MYFLSTLKTLSVAFPYTKNVRRDTMNCQSLHIPLKISPHPQDIFTHPQNNYESLVICNLKLIAFCVKNH